MSLSTGSSGASSQSALDWLKWLVVVALVVGGVYGNWYFQNESLLYRVVGLLALAAVAIVVALQTDKGRSTWSLMKESRAEIRRVVWPKREELIQTTIIVLVLVLIFALILWLLDSGLGWLVSSIIG
ncbi:MAG: preprotein translocase subunit SecE [Gammaproteobacteria bacterium]|nr:preprotein translocase subunit SecE [Gammaproteobacteria bacterium]|tara:strand:+ start:343 stop:723 length:381 start_codon:yes stop_codon:yes gene_type:complete